MNRILSTVSLVTLALMLSACGGGGSSSTPNTASSAPPPVAPPSGTGTGTGTGTNTGTGTGSGSGTSAPATPARSAEYNASGAVVGMNAGAAYDKALNGAGVILADIDTGIDQNNTQFTGRISADSKSFDSTVARCTTCAPETVSFSLQDIQGHGTETASVMAAAADGVGMQGVAPGATILALKIAAPDLTNATPTSGPIAEGSGANTANLAPAIVYAVDHGAFAISMSLNGTATGQMAIDQKTAMDYVAKNDRLVIESVSNNVGEDSSAAGQIGANMVGADMSNKDYFLFGIRVDANHNAPAGDGVPGNLADRTLSVVATGVNAAEIGGGTSVVTGNSFAAPAIAGAAALLKQYWPQLGGKEIASILLSTADDLGAPGVDQVYGVGLLDVAKALQAQNPTLGTSSVNASPISSSSITFGAAYGGASAAATWSKVAGSTVVLDRYGRDYKFNVGALARAQANRGVSVYGATLPTQHFAAAPATGASEAMGFTSAGGDSVHPTTGMPRNASFSFQTGPHTSVSGSMGAGIEDSGLATGSMLRSTGLATSGTSMTVSSFGYQMSFGMASESSQIGRPTSSTVQRMLVQMPSGLRLGMTAAHENGSALGLAGTGAFSITSSDSTFATVGWAGSFHGFGLVADAMVGRTKVRTGSDMIGFSAPILSTGFRVQADHMAFGGVASLGLTSPMRVQSANLRYTAPVGYDTDTLTLVNQTSNLNLAPSSREMDIEGGWSKAFSETASFSMGAAYSMNSENVQGRTSAGAWLRFSKSF